jgi:hypothetical protein
MTFTKFTVPELKNIIKQYNLRTRINGYSKMKKDELIVEMNKHLNIENDVITIKEIVDKVIKQIVKEEKKKQEEEKKEEVVIPVEKSIEEVTNLFEQYIKYITSENRNVKKYTSEEQFNTFIDLLKEDYLKTDFNRFIKPNTKYPNNSKEGDLIVIYRKNRDKRRKVLSDVNFELKDFQYKNKKTIPTGNTLNDLELKELTRLWDTKGIRETRNLISEYGEAFNRKTNAIRDEIIGFVNAKEHQYMTNVMRYAYFGLIMKSLSVGRNVGEASNKAERFLGISKEQISKKEKEQRELERLSR